MGGGVRMEICEIACIIDEEEERREKEREMDGQMKRADKKRDYSMVHVSQMLFRMRSAFQHNSLSAAMIEIETSTYFDHTQHHNSPHSMCILDTFFAVVFL